MDDWSAPVPISSVKWDSYQGLANRGSRLVSLLDDGFNKSFEQQLKTLLSKRQPDEYAESAQNFMVLKVEEARALANSLVVDLNGKKDMPESVMKPHRGLTVELGTMFYNVTELFKILKEAEKVAKSFSSKGIYPEKVEKNVLVWRDYYKGKWEKHVGATKAAAENFTKQFAKVPRAT